MSSASTDTRRGSPATVVDFSRPAPLGQDETRAVRAVHDHMAELLSPMLTTRTRAPYRLGVEDLGMVTGNDLRSAVAEPCVLAIVDMVPLPQPMLLRVPMGLASVTVDLLLGGPGTPEAAEVEPTPVELQILRRVLEQCLPTADRAWRPHVNIASRLRDLTCDVTATEVLPLGEPFLRVDLSVTVEDDVYDADLWLPNEVLLAALRSVSGAGDRAALGAGRSAGQLGIGAGSSAAGDDGHDDHSPLDGGPPLAAALEDVPVEVRVTFPGISMTPTEILGLRPGDVVPLSPADVPLHMQAGGIDLGTVRPARDGDRTACVVLSILTAIEGAS